eukprot:Platyproteum_vivax@DN2950_c0_g1_i3.p1
MKYDIEGVNTRMDVCLIHCCWYIDDRIGSRYLLSSYTSLAMASTSPASLAWTTFAMPSSFFVKASLEEAYTILSFTLAVSGAQSKNMSLDVEAPALPTQGTSTTAYRQSAGGRALRNSSKSPLLDFSTTIS